MGTKTTIVLTIVLIFVVGIVIGFSLNATAQTSSSIPAWIKNTARWWADGQVSDTDFIKALQWLINQKILIVPQSTQPHTMPSQPSSQGQSNVSPGFSSTDCHRDETITGIVHMTGKFTNGPIPYSFVSLQLGLINENGNVVATGVTIIENMGAYQTKIFDAEAVYSGQFAKCNIEVMSTIP